jgi:DNA-binding response OmpR family regulator
MPGVGGVEFIAAQREDAALARLPVIMVSTARDVSAVAEGLGLSWAKKPVELEQLIELIRPFFPPESRLAAS